MGEQPSTQVMFNGASEDAPTYCAQLGCTQQNVSMQAPERFVACPTAAGGRSWRNVMRHAANCVLFSTRYCAAAVVHLCCIDEFIIN